MNSATAGLVASFTDRAEAAQAAEKVLRERVSHEIAEVTRQRAFAFRRARLVRALAAAVDEEDAEKSVTAQRRAVTGEVGWSGESEAEQAVLDRLAPVANVIRACACGDSAEAQVAVAEQLAEFEAWFEQSHGKSFYALFDQYVTEVPVVDF